MPLDGHTVAIQLDLWDRFKTYLHDAYQDNVRHWPVIDAWHQKLSQNPSLHLAFSQVRNEVTNRTFRAYVVNHQIAFSLDQAVLTLPFARSPLDRDDKIYPDQLAGVWLNDFGDTPYFFKACEKKARRLVRTAGDKEDCVITSVRGDLKPYLHDMLAAIREVGTERLLPGRKANKVSNAALRFFYSDAFATDFHRDYDKETNASPREAPYRWTRVIIHPLIGAGTSFALEGNAAIPSDEAPKLSLTLPLGMTSSHCGFIETDQRNVKDPIGDFTFWGIRHAGMPHERGRAIFIKAEEHGLWEPVRGEKSPWVITPLAYAA